MLGDRFTADIRFKFQSESMTTAFLDIYDDKAPFVFIPFPTCTGWTSFNLEQVWEVTWHRDFDFYQPAKNNWDDVGFNGRMRLSETPR